ncbi:hypothetical protein GCM10028784_24240 [Myceligenerans cantabricum]
MDPLRLVGLWDFRREVRDHLDGAEYVAVGEAAFDAEDDDRIRWAEHGTLHGAGRTTRVSRTLFLVRGTAGWRVTFEDGRDFHSWTGGEVEHPCGRDLYDGHIDTPADADAPWTVRWRVTGPTKDYTMTSRYARPPADR